MKKLIDIHLYTLNGKHELDLLYKNIIDNPEDLNAMGVYADRLSELNFDMQAELCWTQFKLTEYLEKGIDGSYWQITNSNSDGERKPHLLVEHDLITTFCPLIDEGIKCKFCQDNADFNLLQKKPIIF